MHQSEGQAEKQGLDGFRVSSPRGHFIQLEKLAFRILLTRSCTAFGDS